MTERAEARTPDEHPSPLTDDPKLAGTVALVLDRLMPALRHAFDEGPVDPPPIDSALARLYRLSPGEPERKCHLFLATRSIPDTVVRAGDYLTFRGALKPQADPKVSGAVVVRVPRAQLATVEKHRDCLWVLHVQFPPNYYTSAKALEDVRTFLRRRQSPKWNDATSPLIIIRPLVAPVSQPIEAKSDDGAIFEPLTAAGGKVPGPEGEAS